MTTVARLTAKTLKDSGVQYIFGVPSGNWVDFMAAIEETDGLEFMLISNEASGGFMAAICWRLTGKIAACFGTFGPGACNMTTGVCGGFLDRSPMIAFSDEMNDTMRNRTCQMNIDHQALFKPITKWSTRLKPGSVRETITKAIHIAASEVPGPVHIGLPMGIGALDSPIEDSPDFAKKTIPMAEIHVIETMSDLVSNAKKPVIALGIGAVRSRIKDIVLTLLEKYNIPAVLTPMAKGMVPEDHPFYAGVLNHALGDIVGMVHQQADLVIGIGFDPVELNYEDWMPNVPLIHIDTTPADLDTELFNLGCDVVGDINETLKILAGLDCPKKEWNTRDLMNNKKDLFSKLKAAKNSFGVLSVLEKLREKLPDDGIMTCDVGAHLHVIGQQWETPAPDCQLMTNGCSSMGFAIPAAIAAKLSCPDRQVCCVVGDGGYYMMAGEMATALRLNRNIVFIVLIDSSLSLIQIKQQRKGNSAYGTQLDNQSMGHLSSHTLFGVPVLHAKTLDEYMDALNEAFTKQGPVIIEAYINTSDYENLVLKGNR